VKQLWDALTGDESLVAEAAADVLVQLVLSDVCEFTYALHGVLNRAPSSR
jgi:hypothetical protein